jgi:hypothetical protein
MNRIEVNADASMPDIVAKLRDISGESATIHVSDDTALLLTASEFRAIAAAAERNQVAISIDTDDPLRRQLAAMFRVPIALPSQPVENGDVALEESTAGESVAVQVAPPVTANGAGEGVGTATADVASETHEDSPESAPADEAAEKPVAPTRRPRRSPKPLLAVLGLFAAIAAGIGFYWLFFSTATVDIVLQRKEVSVQISYSVIEPGTELSSNDMAAIASERRIFDISKRISKETTGVRTVGVDTASGEVVLRNPTGESVTIGEGETFESFDGTAFLFDETVEVPAATDGGDTPGEATAGVSSAEPGTVGNREIGALTGRLENGVYYSNRTAAVEGGTDQDISVVSQEDIDSLGAHVVDELLGDARDSLFTDGYIPLPGSVEIRNATSEFSDDVGAEVETVSVDATIRFEALAYDPQILIDAAVAALQGQVPSGYVLESETPRFSSQEEGASENGVTVVTATVTGEARPDRSDEELQTLANELAGRSEEEAMEYLQGLPYVAESEITYEPAWLPGRIPSSGGRIEVDVR